MSKAANPGDAGLPHPLSWDWKAGVGGAILTVGSEAHGAMTAEGKVSPPAPQGYSSAYPSWVLSGGAVAAQC